MISGILPTLVVPTFTTTFKHTEAPSLFDKKFNMEFTVFIALVSILCLIIFIYIFTYGLRLFNTKPLHLEDIEAVKARKNMEF
jgi:type II secretory pathway component PulF|uniref:Uncharacterized protein n=1 Tax=Panagrolaimus sp. PS1159 TaxID=55785 RepID=A0AC35GBU3_9BILA